MSAPEEFETLLKEVVNAKRLSASKMTGLTDIAMKNMEHDTQLVSILYRTHRSLSTVAAKISSLYVFDALSRAAKHYSTKHGLTGDAFTQPGNAASFLFKVGGVVEGLFQDMVATGSAEAKDKTKKILDIWVKGNTFPSSILSQLSDVLKGTEKGAYSSFLVFAKYFLPMQSNIFIFSKFRLAMTEICLRSVSTLVPETKPTVTADPRLPNQANHTTTPSLPQNVPVAGLDPQTALLALLSQAAASTTAVPPALVPQIAANIGSSTPQLDAAQLAVIQQLAHTAASVPSVSQSLPTPESVNVQKFPSSPGVNGSSHTPSLPSGLRNEPQAVAKNEQRHTGYRSPERNSRPDPRYDESDNMRGRYRGGYRNRGRGDRFPGRNWDVRDRDRYRDSDRDHSPPRSGRGNRSRSRSPPSRYGGRRDPRNYSPPRRSYTSAQPPAQRQARESEPGKDEFGRDIRNGSPIANSTDDKSPSQPKTTPQHSPPPISPRSPPTAQSTHDLNHDQKNVLASVTANTSSGQPSAFTISKSVSHGPGLESFDLSAFDYTSPASWEALGKMWQVTHGYLPSTEQLMQYVIMSGTGPSQADTSTQDTNGLNYQRNDWSGNRGRGRGGGGFSRGRGGSMYGNGREHGPGEYDDNSQATDAVVLGGGTEDVTQYPMAYEASTDISVDPRPTPVSTAGRMQKVGDKWVFVRGPATDSS
ncbi:LOW QUALITY PROTEIN: hypothetical protein CVT26_014204 [Gymnopilus dilepis]|uniref:CID domain-containing protein n=1 Tax=Gymnopilus dilepis TaxID=231916 RepID=A0A409VU97_9AGAR|nr:LOW QUALITY PROTEIN: hypothetical protein CVT26_014204 [Gymnopilus dilepis]